MPPSGRAPLLFPLSSHFSAINATTQRERGSDTAQGRWFYLRLFWCQLNFLVRRSQSRVLHGTRTGNCQHVHTDRGHVFSNAAPTQSMVRIAPLPSPPAAPWSQASAHSDLTIAAALAACLGPAMAAKRPNLEQDAANLSPADAIDSRKPTARLAGSFASCLPAASATLEPAAKVSIQLSRAANLLPMCTSSHSRAETSQQLWARAVWWLAGEPAAQRKTATVAVDAVSGGASWHDHDAPAQAFDEAITLPLPVVGRSTLVIELQLFVAPPSAAEYSCATPMDDSSGTTGEQEDTVRGDTDHASQDAALAKGGTALELVGGGVAHIPLSRLASGGGEHSMSSWVHVVGTGPPRTDGEPLGECELLVVITARHLIPPSPKVGSTEPAIGGDDGNPSSSSEPPVGQTASSTTTSSGATLRSHPPTSRVAKSRSARDGHGFALQVPELSHAAMVEYRALVSKRQLRRWQQLGAALAPPSFRREGMLHEAALGFPPTLRPRLWLHYSGAEAMRHEACSSGSYARCLTLQTKASASAAALLTGVHGAVPCNPTDAGVVLVGDLRWLPALLQRMATCGKRAAAQLLGASSGVPEDGMAAVARQIELDLPRTFPEHAVFAAEPGRASLRRVLHAHARRNPEIGYTQSLNFIAAFLLLQCPADGVRTHQTASGAPGPRLAARPPSVPTFSFAAFAASALLRSSSPEATVGGRRRLFGCSVRSQKGYYPSITRPAWSGFAWITSCS